MPTNDPEPHSQTDRPPIDANILRTLDEGRCTPRYLSRQLGRQQSYVSQRLGELVDDNLVEKVDRGLYELNTGLNVIEVPNDE
jgi:DNA-binding IclR family transcriptional regulator